MIVLYAFNRLPPPIIGGTRDLRAQWVLEETQLPYRVHGLDFTAGDLDRPDYARLNCFRLVPAIDDDGLTVAESGAIALYLAEKAGKLIPADPQGRAEVMQWCFAALATVEHPLMEIQAIDISGGDFLKLRRHKLVKQARLWLGRLEERLRDHEWIAAAEFTVADILLATVLREIRQTDLLGEYGNVSDYYARALARPAWCRTLTLYANRLGMSVADIE